MREVGKSDSGGIPNRREVGKAKRCLRCRLVTRLPKSHVLGRESNPECMQDANLVEVGICLLPLRPKTERLQAIWKAKRSKGECGEHCEGGSGEGRRLVLSSARFDQVPLGPNNLPTYRVSLALMERPLRLGIACFRSAAYFGRGRLSPRKHNLFRSALSQNTKTAPISENH